MRLARALMLGGVFTACGSYGNAQELALPPRAATPGQSGSAGLDGGVSPPDHLPPLSAFVAARGPAVGVGTSIGCAITNDRKIACWGTPNLQRDVLAKNAYLIDVGDNAAAPAELAVGSHHACARFDDGSAQCWGAGDRGELGDGTGHSPTTETGSVRVALGAVSLTEISAGDQHTCAIGQGHVYCWGYNEDGELGDGTTTERDAPQEVPGIADATAVSAGTNFTCILHSTGKVSCWGDNGYSQIGSAPGKDGRPVLTPTVVPGLASVTALDAGSTAACAIANGRVTCWGDRWYAPLSAEDKASPSPLVTVGAIAGATALSIRRGHSSGATPGCAVTTQGVACWPSPKAAPVTATTIAGSAGATAVSTGDGAECGLFTDQTVMCWGSNAANLLGDGSFESHPAPIDVPDAAAAKAVFTAPDESCVVGTDGHAQCWGVALSRDVDEDGHIRAVTQLDGATDVAFARAPCGLVAGTPKCAPDPQTPTSAPLVISGVTGADGIALGLDDAGCATVGGALACWHSGSPPVAKMVTGVTGVSKVVVSDDVSPTACILFQNGVSCWDNVPQADALSSMWRAESGFDGATELAGTSGYACSVTPAGVYCHVDDPRQGVAGLVPNTAGATHLAVGYAHACAVIGASVQCWGNGDAGQLGPASFTRTEAPIVVPNLAVPEALVAAGDHTCALEAAGRVQCWGSNIGGVISPRVDARSSPTPVRLRW